MQSIHFYDFQYYQTQLKDIRSLLVSFLNEKNKFKTDYKNNMIELQQKAKENKVIEQKYNDSLKQFHGLKNELNNLDVKIAQSKSDEKMKSEIEKWKKRASSNKVKLRESEETVRRLDLKYRNALLTTQKMCAKIKNLEKRQDELMNVLIKKNVLRKVGSLNDEIQALKRKCKMSNFEDAIKNRYLDESSPEEFSVKSNFHDEISEIEFGQF